MPITFPNCYCQCYCSPNKHLQPQAIVPFSNANPNFCKCTSFTPRGFYPNDKLFLVCCNECVIRSPQNAARSYKTSSSTMSSSDGECCCCKKCACSTLDHYRRETKRKSRKMNHGNCYCEKNVQNDRGDNNDGRHHRSKRSRYKDTERCKCICKCKSRKTSDDDSYNSTYTKSKRKPHKSNKTEYEDMSENEESSDTRSVVSSKKQSKTTMRRLPVDRDPKSYTKKQAKPVSNPASKEKSGKSKKSKVSSKAVPAKKPPRERKEKVRISGHIIGDMFYHESNKGGVDGKTAEDIRTGKKLNIGRVQNTADALRIRLEEKDRLRSQQNEKLAEKQHKPCPCQQKVCKPCQMVPPTCQKMCGQPSLYCCIRS